MIKLSVFVAASIGIFSVSRRSLRNPRSHGFFRFFAFELLVILILVNADGWFSDALSPIHIISWFLLLCSAILALNGFVLLRHVGKSEESDESDTLFRFERTTALVTVGLYGYIRHPLYSSLLFGAWGTFLKEPSPIGILLVIAITANVMATARVEESENLQRFGTEYSAYMKTTKKFIPFLY